MKRKLDQIQPTPDRLREMFRLDPEGGMYRLERMGVRGLIGSKLSVFCSQRGGKRKKKTRKMQILLAKVCGKTHMYHRLVFAHHNGYYPAHVYFKDGDFRNIRPENLSNVRIK